MVISAFASLCQLAQRTIFPLMDRILIRSLALKLPVLAWLFVLPCVGSAQNNGDPILERCILATTKAQSLQADIIIQGVGKFQNVKVKGSLQLQKPNRGRIEFTSTESPAPIRRYCDGKLLSYFVDKTHYVLEEASDDGDNLVRDCRCNEAVYFFKPEEMRILRSTGKEMQREGVQIVGGVPCTVLHLVDGPKGITLRLYIGPGDLIYGTDALTRRDGAVFGFKSRLTKVKINPRFPTNTFNFKARTGEVAYVSGPPGPALRAIRRLGKMPQTGAAVRDFTLNDLAGKAVTLSETLQANKVTVLNFWGVACLPCRTELPLFNARLAEWKAKGIGVLTVNLSDRAEAVRQVWREDGLSLPVVLKGEGIASRYGVFAIPTTFLLDANGKVLDTIVGVDMQELQNALERTVGK